MLMVLGFDMILSDVVVILDPLHAVRAAGSGFSREEGKEDTGLCLVGQNF